MTEAEKAVKAVLYSQALKRYEGKLEQLKKNGISDPNLKLVVKTLKKTLEEGV